MKSMLTLSSRCTRAVNIIRANPAGSAADLSRTAEPGRMALTGSSPHIAPRRFLSCRMSFRYRRLLPRVRNRHWNEPRSPHLRLSPAHAPWAMAMGMVPSAGARTGSMRPDHQGQWRNMRACGCRNRDVRRLAATSAASWGLRSFFSPLPSSQPRSGMDLSLS